MILIIFYWKYENIFVSYILYKTLTGARPLCIRFDKVDGGYDGTRDLVLFDPEKYDDIYNRVR